MASKSGKKGDRGRDFNDLRERHHSSSPAGTLGTRSSVASLHGRQARVLLRRGYGGVTMEERRDVHGLEKEERKREREWDTWAKGREGNGCL